MGPPARRRHDEGRGRRAGRQAWRIAGKLAGLCRLLNEHGGAIEADLLRFYQIDLLDFYRGTLSARRLGVLVRQLPAESATVRAINDGQPPLSRVEQFIADLWSLWAKKDHPVRAEMEAKARAAAKHARVSELRTKFENRKRTYGLG
jgi:hypothetical protein